MRINAKRLPTLHRFPMVTSTQDVARTLLETGRARCGHVVVADEQTAGRGRHGRTWLSPAGGLYASLIVSPRPIPALACGVAIAHAFEALGVDVSLKWPNDVELQGRKLAGILIEAVNDLLLIGIGANLIEAPLPGAISARTIGREIRRADLLLGIWQHLEGSDPKDVLPDYRRLCGTLGERVRISREDGTAIEGIAEDVDEAGHLLVRVSDAVETIVSGTCEQLSTTESGRLD